MTPREKSTKSTVAEVDEIKKAIRKKGANWVAEESELTGLDAEEKQKWLGSVPEPSDTDTDQEGK